MTAQISLDVYRRWSDVVGGGIMSYDIELVDETGERIVLDSKHNLMGGTYALGGTRDAWLNVTYNYAKHFYRVLDPEKGIRWLYGKRAKDTVPRLWQAIRKLDPNMSEDYWEATEGNAREALVDLVCLAELAPEGIWQGD